MRVMRSMRYAGSRDADCRVRAGARAGTGAQPATTADAADAGRAAADRDATTEPTQDAAAESEPTAPPTRTRRLPTDPSPSKVRSQRRQTAPARTTRKPASATGSPQHFEPTEKVRPDFDVAFPVDI